MANEPIEVEDQVFVLRGGDGEPSWRVYFRGVVEPAAFNSKGAAQAFLGALRRGTRKPEARPHEDQRSTSS